MNLSLYSFFISEYKGITTLTSNLSVAASATESEPITSASPPVAIKGVDSDATKRIFFFSFVFLDSVFLNVLETVFVYYVVYVAFDVVDFEAAI